MRNKKILLTGGAGFIGSHLATEFVRLGWEVVVLDNLSSSNKLPVKTMNKIAFIEGDVRDAVAVNKAAKDCSVIVHLAAVVGVDEVINRSIEMIETETLGMHNIVNAAIQNRVKKILYASSSAVYKETSGAFSMENDDLCLVNTYAVAKHLNEKYLEALTLSENISTNALRFFNVYGDRQDCRMVLPRFFKQALSGEAIEVFGDGNQTRDFTHIDDVIRGIVALTKKEDLSGIYNISRGVETSILDLARSIKTLCRSKSSIICTAFPESRLTYKVSRRVGSSEKLFQDTGV